MMPELAPYLMGSCDFRELNLRLTPTGGRDQRNVSIGDRAIPWHLPRRPAKIRPEDTTEMRTACDKTVEAGVIITSTSAASNCSVLSDQLLQHSGRAVGAVQRLCRGNWISRNEIFVALTRVE
jgi:hypothetical protein